MTELISGCWPSSLSSSWRHVSSLSFCLPSSCAGILLLGRSLIGCLVASVSYLIAGATGICRSITYHSRKSAEEIIICNPRSLTGGIVPSWVFLRYRNSSFETWIRNRMPGPKKDDTKREMDYRLTPMEREIETEWSTSNRQHSHSQKMNDTQRIIEKDEMKIKKGK